MKAQTTTKKKTNSKYLKQAEMTQGFCDYLTKCAQEEIERMKYYESSEFLAWYWQMKYENEKSINDKLQAEAQAQVKKRHKTSIFALQVTIAMFDNGLKSINTLNTAQINYVEAMITKLIKLADELNEAVPECKA
jgi:hypothetical protein